MKRLYCVTNVNYFRFHTKWWYWINNSSKNVTSMLLCTAKEKRSEIKRPKTDGGMKPPSPSASEQLVLDLYEGRPSMCGLPGGIETAGNTC